MLNSANHPECIRKLDLVLKTEPNVEAFKLKVLPRKCKCLSKNKESKEAIKFCTEALKNIPDDEEVLVDRAEAYLAEEDFESAIKVGLKIVTPFRTMITDRCLAVMEFLNFYFPPYL